MSRIACAILLALSVVLAGCGGGSGESPLGDSDAVRGIQVSVEPGTKDLQPGDPCQFRADVTGATSTSVTWSVDEAIDGGLVTSSGQYTAPSTEGTCHVRATSIEDPSKSGVAVIRVSGTGGGTGGTSIQVGVVPGALVLRTGDTCRFTANVAGATNTAVTWSVDEEIDGGLVTSSGQYTAPSTEGTCHVRATSIEDPSKSGVAVITVCDTGETPPGEPGVSISITPKEVTLPPNLSMQFTATVSGHSNTKVTWTVQESGGGTITQNGVYTTPNQVMTVHVTATSQADPTKSATATVNVTTDLPPFPPPPPL